VAGLKIKKKESRVAPKCLEEEKQKQKQKEEAPKEPPDEQRLRCQKTLE